MYSTTGTHTANGGDDTKIILYPKLQPATAEPQPKTRFNGPAMFRNCDVLIRPFVTADAAAMFDAARESMADLRHWMTWCQPGYSVVDAQAFVAECGPAWQNGEHYSFAIINAADNSFLGSVGLNNINRVHQFANIGYWVRTSAGGRGIATAALRLVGEFGLRDLELRRLEILIPEVNIASQRVAQKAGAKFEGLLRQRLMIQGRLHDATMYSLVLSDLPRN